MSVFAYTVPEGFYPEYISVYEYQQGMHVAVRGKAYENNGVLLPGDTSTIFLTKEQAYALAEAILTTK